MKQHFNCLIIAEVMLNTVSVAYFGISKFLFFSPVMPLQAAGSTTDYGQITNSNNTIYRPFNSWQPFSSDTK